MFRTLVALGLTLAIAAVVAVAPKSETAPSASCCKMPCCKSCQGPDTCCCGGACCR
jgi:hypothetical protein